MGNFVKFVRKANLIEDFESRGMNGVAAEFASKSLCISRRWTGMPQKKRARRATTTSRQQDRTDDTAGSFLDGLGVLVCRSSGSSGRSGHGSFHLGPGNLAL